MAKNFLSRCGLPGKACLLRGICEIAEVGALRGEGLVSRAVQAILLMEHAGEGSDDRLVEFLAARAVGRKKEAQCSSFYPCPATNVNVTAALIEALSNDSN